MYGMELVIPSPRRILFCRKHSFCSSICLRGLAAAGVNKTINGSVFLLQPHDFRVHCTGFPGQTK